jgi:uncharacterized protein (DUF2249 family)/CRP-like cAMP-binding protein
MLDGEHAGPREPDASAIDIAAPTANVSASYTKLPLTNSRYFSQHDRSLRRGFERVVDRGDGVPAARGYGPHDARRFGAGSDLGKRLRGSVSFREGTGPARPVAARMRIVRLDVRQLPLWERHPMIFAAFDNLRDGEVLLLVNDHEPRPLRLQFADLRPGRFSWSPRNLGSDRWEVEIRPISEPPREHDDAAATGTIAAVLRRSALFGAVAPATREELAAQSTLRRFSHGAVIMPQGETWPYVGIVCEGTIAVVGGSSEGRELLLYEVLPFETFGEIAAIDDGTTFGSASVMSRAALISYLPRSAFLRAFAQDAALGREVARICTQRFRLLTERLTAAVSRPILARVAAAILPYAPPDRGMVPVLAPLDILTLTDLAIAVGTVREVVGRALITLDDAKAIERVRGRIVRADRERLSTFL